MVKRDLITYIVLLLALILIGTALRFFVFEPHTVRPEEANTFMAEGDFVVATKPAQIDYNDFVLYKIKGTEYIGRVIAKEGDTVTYMDDVLYLNDKVKEEPYLTELKTAYQSQPNHGEYFTDDFTIQTLTQTVSSAIPENEYLILNDSRTNQVDSRTFGMIDKSDIIGVVSFRVLPLSEFGFLDVE